MKYSALLSLEAYASDETVSSDNEETGQKHKVDASPNSSAEIKDRAKASVSSVVSPKKPTETSHLTESELELNNSLSINPAEEAENAVASSFSYSLISYLKEPIKTSHLSDNELQQENSFSSPGKLKRDSDNIIVHNLDKSTKASHSSKKRLGASNSPAKVKKRRKKSKKNSKSNLKEPTKKSRSLKYDFCPPEVETKSGSSLVSGVKVPRSTKVPEEIDLSQDLSCIEVERDLDNKLPSNPEESTEPRPFLEDETNSLPNCTEVEKNSHNLSPSLKEPTKSNCLLEDQNNSLPKCTEVKKDSDIMFLPQIKEPTEVSHLSELEISETEYLSCWPTESQRKKTCHKDSFEVVDLSDSEVELVETVTNNLARKKNRDTSTCSFSVAAYFKEANFLSELEQNKTNDLQNEDIQVLDGSHSTTNQSVSLETQAAVKRKKCKEKKSKKKHLEKKTKKKSKKKTSKHMNDNQNESSEVVDISKISSSKKHKADASPNSSAEIKDHVGDNQNGNDNRNKSSEVVDISKSSSSKDKRRSLVCNEYSGISDSEDSSDDGQCTTTDDDGLQAAKASCFAEFPHIFSTPVSSIPLPSSSNVSTSTSLKRKYSETKEDISDSTPSSKRSRSVTKEASSSTLSPNLNNSATKRNISTPSLKWRHSKTKEDLTTQPTSSNWNHSLTDKNCFTPRPSTSRYPPPPFLKESHSMTEGDSDNKYESHKSTDSNRSFNFTASNSPANRGRRSFPDRHSSRFSSPLYETPKRKFDDFSRRQSFPGKFSHQSNYRACNTDQTPYSPSDSFRRYKRMRTELPYYNASDLITFKSEEGFIDCHCHIDFLFQRLYHEGTFEDFQKENRDTFPECFKGCLAIFCNPLSFKKRRFWQGFLEEENVWASFGCHPHNARDYSDEVEDSLRTALEHPKVRALGEIGLDYSNRNNCPRDIQQEVFRRQLKIALEKKLPLVIHCRDAHEDGMDIMKEMVPKNYFIHLHCFTDTWEVASQWLHEFPRLYIGITNVVTFPTASETHEVAKKIPLTRLLLETDTPYFIPKPLLREHPDTRFSHPGMALHVAAQIAALKGGIPLELVLSMTRQNTKNIFKI